MQNCLSCKQGLIITEMHCNSCDINFKGEFRLNRLARLPKEYRNLAEQLLFCGGNLKELAIKMDLSYPTLRKHVDDMIEQLVNLQKEDQKEIEIILTAIENKEIQSEKGLRLIQEINGEY